MRLDPSGRIEATAQLHDTARSMNGAQWMNTGITEVGTRVATPNGGSLLVKVVMKLMVISEAAITASAEALMSLITQSLQRTLNLAKLAPTPVAMRRKQKGDIKMRHSE